MTAAPVTQAGTRALRVGIAGHGAIGARVASALDRGIEGLALTAIAARDGASLRERTAALAARPVVTEAEHLPEHADIVVECAPAAAFERIAGPAVEHGRCLVVASAGALLERPGLIDRARETGARVIVATGALIGFDAVRAAAEGTVHSVTIETRKPPAGLRGAPYLAEHDIEVEGLIEARRIFEGSAREAAAAFPANVNVAAALSLAGVGPDRTRLALWADPAVDRNTHHIRVDADSARFSMSIENIPTADNPRTGRITPLSVVATLRSLAAPVRIGT